VGVVTLEMKYDRDSVLPETLVAVTIDQEKWRWRWPR